MSSKQECLLLSRALAWTAYSRSNAVSCSDVLRARERGKTFLAPKRSEEFYGVEIVVETRIIGDRNLGCDLDGNSVFLTSASIFAPASALGESTFEQECWRKD